MSNRRKMRHPGGSSADPSAQAWAEAVEEWRRARELSDELTVHRYVAGDMGQRLDVTSHDSGDESGPEIKPRRVLVLIAWLAFLALVVCGCTAWLVEWLR